MLVGDLMVSLGNIVDIKMNKLTHSVIGEEAIRVGQAGLQKGKPTTAGADSDSEDDLSSLEESVEEHKQPQTEEIMNAELVARVILLFLHL